MIAYLKCILLYASMVSVSLLDGRLAGNTSGSESVICVVEAEETQEELQQELVMPEYCDAFWITEEETVYLLDSYGNRILEVAGENITEILLSETVLPADIIYWQEEFYIYDDLLLELQIYGKDGSLRFQKKVELNNDYVKQLELTSEGVVLTTYGGKAISADRKKQQLILGEIKNKVTVDKGAYDFAEVVGTDAKGNIYAVYTSLVKESSIISGELVLQRTSADGTYLGAYRLPLEKYGYLPGKYVQVLQDGRVYLMIPKNGRCEVRRIDFDRTVRSLMEEIEENAKALEQSYTEQAAYTKLKGTACEEEVKLSRAEVFLRVQKMASYRWTLKAENTQTSKVSKTVILPREIAALVKKHSGETSWSETVTGIPYCWGGFSSLYSGYNGVTFDVAISKKYVAGNIGTTGYYKELTAGLDCSGLVSASYGFEGKYSTTGLLWLGKKVDSAYRLQNMDFFVLPGSHIIFYHAWLEEGTFLISEAAIREGKVTIAPKSINQLIVVGRYQMRSPW